MVVSRPFKLSWYRSTDVTVTKHNQFVGFGARVGAGSQRSRGALAVIGLCQTPEARPGYRKDTGNLFRVAAWRCRLAPLYRDSKIGLPLSR